MAATLVTGAAGFVGANLVRTLVDRGEEVHAMVRPSSDLWRLNGLEGRMVMHEADMARTGAVRGVVSRIHPTHVYHLAHYGGNRGQDNGAQIRAVVIDGTAELYAACADEPRIEAIVHAGSSSEYGSKRESMKESLLPEPNSEYGVAKLWATLYGEHLRREKGLPITTLRLFSVYGPYEERNRLFPAVILALLRGQQPSLANPDTSRDFVYVADVVSALLRAGGRPHGIFNVGTGVHSTLADAVRAIQSSLGSTALLSWGGHEGRAFDGPLWVADTSLAEKELGWGTETDLTTGVSKTVEWFQSNTHLYA